MKKDLILGELVATPGAVEALRVAGQDYYQLLKRHGSGDWGDLDEHDKRVNEEGLEHGYRIMSVYRLQTGVKVWLITEADRSVTTLLLPEDY